MYVLRKYKQKFSLIDRHNQESEYTTWDGMSNSRPRKNTKWGRGSVMPTENFQLVKFQFMNHECQNVQCMLQPTCYTEPYQSFILQIINYHQKLSMLSSKSPLSVSGFPEPNLSKHKAFTGCHPTKMTVSDRIQFE